MFGNFFRPTFLKTFIIIPKFVIVVFQLMVGRGGGGEMEGR